MTALAVLVAYGGLVAWSIWPLPLHVASHLPDVPGSQYDTLFATWTLSWQTHALATSPGQLLHANIYHPAPNALLYGPTAWGLLPWFAPVFLLTGDPTLSINVTLFGAIVLTACAFHWVAFRWTGSHAAGAAAAVTFVATPWTLRTWLPVAPSYASLMYFPLLVYLAAGSLSGWRPVLLIVLVTLQCLTDPVYVAPVVLGPLGLLAMVRVLRPATRQNGVRLLAVTIAATALLAPAYWGYFAVRAANPELARQSLWFPGESGATKLAPFMRHGLFAPPVSLLESWRTGTAAARVPVVSLLLTGAGALALLARRRSSVPRVGWGHAAVWAAVGLIAALPPVVRGPFGTELPLPYWFVDVGGQPLMYTLRSPLRFQIPALIGLSLLAGLGTAAVLALVRWRRIRMVVACLVLSLLVVEHRSRPAGEDFTWDRPPYPIRRAITADSPLLPALRAGSGPVLELPLGGRAINAVAHAEAMYRSIYHWRPLLNGYASYWPQGFDRRMELAIALPARAALGALVHETGLQTIVVRAYPRTRHRRQWLSMAAKGSGLDLRLIAREGHDLVFEVREDRYPPSLRGQPKAQPTLSR